MREPAARGEKERPTKVCVAREENNRKKRGTRNPEIKGGRILNTYGGGHAEEKKEVYY